MVAETLTASRAANSFPVFKALGAGLLSCAFGTYDIAANVEAGDIFEMCKIPAGSTIVGGYLYGKDIDTNATETLDMDVGWAANGGSGTYDSADPDGLGNLGVLTGDAFAAGSVSTVVGLVYPFSGVFALGTLPTFSKETTIQVVANAAAATFTAGAISVVVFYVCD